MNTQTNIIQKTARILLGAFMTFAGIGHLTFQREEFLAQVPRWLPDNEAFLDFVVLSSGVVEILLGLSMLFLVKHQVKVGLALALFYVLIFPGNISQYTNEISAFGLDTDNKRLIRLFFQPVLILWALWSTGALYYLLNRKKQKDASQDIYSFEAKTLSGKAISLEQYRGKTIVIVNTASKCGLTPQYEGLEKMYQEYKDKGLVILGFPCNQFGSQEKGNSEEISEFCQVNYGVSFPMFEKIEVNGANAHPLYQYLKRQLPGNLILGSRIKWNFTKFVIDKKGKPIKRFAPTTTPEKMMGYLEKVL